MDNLVSIQLEVDKSTGEIDCKIWKNDEDGYLDSVDYYDIYPASYARLVRLQVKLITGASNEM